MSCPSFVTAESQYKKHKELKKEDFNLLQEWAEKQPHFPQLTELQIIIFLHCCYFSNERAKICMEKFFTIRALSPEFASNRNPLTNTPDLLDVFLFAPLPKLTPDGYKVIFIKLMDCDPDRFHLATQMKALDMTTMLTLQQEGPSEGQFLLVDFEGITFGHVGKFGLVVLHKFFIYLQVDAATNHPVMSYPSFVDVEAEYEKNRELKKADVKLLQEWAEKQPHFPRVTEFQVVLFLHSCFHSNEAAKKCMEKFFTVRALCPELFADRNPSGNPPELLDLVVFAPLPKLTPDGMRVFFIKFVDLDADRFALATQVKAFDMSVMLMLQQEGTSTGHIVVADFDGLTFGHVVKLGLTTLKKFFVYIQLVETYQQVVQHARLPLIGHDEVGQIWSHLVRDIYFNPGQIK